MGHVAGVTIHGDPTVHQTLLAAATAFVIGGIATGAVLSVAQSPPPAAPTQASTQAHEWSAHPTDVGQPLRPMLGWGHRMQRHRGSNERAFALVYRQADLQLAPADVQKVAEAFLLRNGNHTWKVTDVIPTSDGPVGFNLSTPEGSIVAKFTMDPHSGRIRRTG
jgi:hypothetical protein